MAVLFSSFSNVKPLSFHAANSVRKYYLIIPQKRKQTLSTFNNIRLRPVSPERADTKP